MIRTTLAVAALAGSISTTLAGDLTEFALPTGTFPGVIRAVSDDGGTVLAMFPSFDDPTERAHRWSNGVWEAVPGERARVISSSLSADGSAFVYSDFATGGGLFLRQGDQTITIQSGPAGPLGAITHDGSAVFYTSPSEQGLSLNRWRDGVSTTLLDLPGDNPGNWQILAGNHQDRFVVNTHQTLQPGTRRAALYDHGVLTEIPALMTAPQFDSFATAVSADASVIAGLEHGWGIDEPYPGGDTAAWISRGGVVSELRVDGYNFLRVDSISADGSLMLAHGLVAGAFGYDTYGSLLIHTDRSTDSVIDLLAAEGVVLELGEWAFAERLSADGTHLAGTIMRLDEFGTPDFAMFTLRIPAPSVTTLIGLGGFFAARRRRA